MNKEGGFNVPNPDEVVWENPVVAWNQIPPVQNQNIHYHSADAAGKLEYSKE